MAPYMENQQPTAASTDSNAQAPSIKSEEPAIKTESPAIKTEAPSTKSESPFVKKEEPSIKTESPYIKTEATPQTNGKYDTAQGPFGLESASLKGKVALVTGAGRGIGRAMALELGRRGASVVVNYANSTGPASDVVSLIKNSGSGADAIPIQADVTEVSQIISLFSQAITHFGKLDIVCSNSGVVSFGHVGDVTEEEYDRVFDTNTRGQFFVGREAYRRLEEGGRLIMMGSITGQAKGVPRHAVYSASKGAVETFVRCMAVDFGDRKITVNAVAPGGIKTDMYHKVCREYIPNGTTLNDDEVDEYAKTWSPMHRVGLPIDVARVVAFLASDDAGWMNGKILGVDGGACM